jgi:heme exporter protein D
MSALGVVEGGWEFVWAAYGTTMAVLLAYSVSLVLRLRSERSRAEREVRLSSEVRS